MRVILNDIEPDEMILGVRAARWLMERFQKDAVISYGDGKDFYAKRNKASITVSACSRTND